jgi:L-lactate dehydrogenase complex protein LldF
MNPRDKFHRQARQAIDNPVLQTALDNNADRRRSAWESAFASLPDADALRSQARAIRQQTIANLDKYLEQFIQRLQENGVHVHRAEDATQAAQIVVDLARSQQAETVAKSKSMVSEEIELNQALQAAGIRPVETDLGEFIVQLRGEHPTHIITPAVHLRREDVAETFERQLGMPYTTDIQVMNDTARRTLRDIFLSAPVGVSGVNFGVAETGTLCLVTNEGNGRMVTTLPGVHIAVMGIERLVPSMQDLAVMLQLLPRSATGQKLTSYVSLINRPRQASEPDGSQERHVVLVDNGRRALAETDQAEALLCIRCGACLNACPVYREVGGKTYASVYPGPIGSLVSPGLFGVERYGHLSKASTLCGACAEACPVQIDFPTLLLRGRHHYVEQVPQPRWISLGMKVYAWLASSPQRYRWSLRLAALAVRLLPRRAGWIDRLPAPLSAWTRSRHFPPFRQKSFHQRWQERTANLAPQSEHAPADRVSRSQNDSPAIADTNLLERFERELEALGGQVIRCARQQAPAAVAEKLRKLGVKRLLAWQTAGENLPSILEHLQQAGVKVLQPDLPKDAERRQQEINRFAQAQAGLTGAQAALADTGTLVVPGGPGRSQLASLLPPVHLAVLAAEDIYPSMSAWLRAAGETEMHQFSRLDLISGPSRTADIEMTLTIGVHGPGRVIVFCLED